MATTAHRELHAPVPSDGYVQSFARGLEVIRSFSADAPEQTLSEVAARSGLTRAGARRFLLTLQTLASVDGSDIVYVMRVHTHKIVSLNLNVGTRLPAYCTSLGRVLLAGLDDAEVKNRLGSSSLSAKTRHTVTDPAEVLARVQQVRRQGWALVNQELEEGLVSAAAPVKNRAGKVVAALNATLAKATHGGR